MSLQYPSALQAAGAVTGATGADIWNSGADASRTGKGDYDLTLDQGADATQCAILITIRGTVQATARVVHTSDTVKQVLLEDPAAAAVDADFDYLIVRAPF